MVTIKKYITWNRFEIRHNVFADPDNSINRLWELITFTGLPYGEVQLATHKDMRRIAILEYDDNDINSDVFTKFMNNYSNFCFTEETPTKIIELLNEWYPNSEGENYFSLDSDGFTIIDNKPIPEDLM